MLSFIEIVEFLRIFEKERKMENNKSLVLTLVLWFFLGSLGAHRFYLGHTGTAAAQLAMAIIGWLTIVFVIGFIPLVALGIWLIVDLIQILTGKLTSVDGTPLK